MEKSIMDRLSNIEASVNKLLSYQAMHDLTQIKIELSSCNQQIYSRFLDVRIRADNFLGFLFGQITTIGVAVAVYSLYLFTGELIYRYLCFVFVGLAVGISILGYRQRRSILNDIKFLEALLDKMKPLNTKVNDISESLHSIYPVETPDP